MAWIYFALAAVIGVCFGVVLWLRRPTEFWNWASSAVGLGVAVLLSLGVFHLQEAWEASNREKECAKLVLGELADLVADLTPASEAHRREIEEPESRPPDLWGLIP